MKNALFTSCDWGTTNLRVRAVEAGRIRQEIRTPQGAASLSSPREFRDALHTAMRKIGAAEPVIISGMAGSSIGWKEIPYATVPFSLDGSDANVEEIEPGIFLISGVRTEKDIMRGEETELIGLGFPIEDALVVLPGTHAKHCRIQNGELVQFSTSLTGEMHALLSRHSILKNSVAEGWVEAGFVEGVRLVEHTPMLQALFRTRTRHLLDGMTGETNGSFLSGLLIGAELAALPPGVPLVLAAGGVLGRAYTLAFETLGLTKRTHILDAEQCDQLAVHGHGKILKNLGL